GCVAAPSAPEGSPRPSTPCNSAKPHHVEKGSLVHLGYSTEDAIFLVRYRRSKWALNNPLFVDYLNTGLDVARLLTGLET
ncbi:hypothetical protein ACFY4C_08490, partial [Actinomadura viridis]|uniref:hypothetical protein n=1 Tax=Actinomadura viridis TaxID=58110 RepID=UPI0036810513